MEGEVRGHPEVVHAGAMDDAEDEGWMDGVFTPLQYSCGSDGPASETHGLGNPTFSQGSPDAFLTQPQVEKWRIAGTWRTRRGIWRLR